MLNETQLNDIKNVDKIIFTTVSKNNKPRSVYVIPSRVEANRIIISNIQMDKTFQNIKENNNCFINVLIPEKDDLQYKLDGTAEILDSGNLFNEIKSYEETNNLPPELKVKAIIIFKINNVEQSNG